MKQNIKPRGSSWWSKNSVHMLLAMCLGVLCGLIFKSQTRYLGELGKLLIQWVKVLAGPLLFFAIVDAFVRVDVRLKQALRMLFLMLLNMIVAITIGMLLATYLKPGEYLKILRDKTNTLGATQFDQIKSIDPIKTLSQYLPTTHILQPFLENSVISIVIFAVLIGVALRYVKYEHEQSGQSEHVAFASFVFTCLKIFERLLLMVTRILPVAVFGVIAQAVGTYGLSFMSGLLVYVGVVLLGLCLQVLVVYQCWISRYAKMPLKTFWSAAKEACVYAFSVNSSLATVPFTLKGLSKLGVKEESARLAACIGTNLNNDGIILYEALAVLCVAQIYGIELSLSMKLMAALSCMLAGIGVAGVPEAGLVSLALALVSVGLPTEVVPFLLSVDWILGRARSVVNVCSDMTCAIVIDKTSFSET